MTARFTARPVIRPVPPVPGCAPALHIYPVLVDFEAIGLTRAKVMTALKSRGIGTQVHYIPLHRQPYYRDRYGDVSIPGAEFVLQTRAIATLVSSHE